MERIYPKIGLLAFFIVVLIAPTPLWSCTIFCAKDDHGHMWAGNNEDYNYFDFSTRIWISPETDSTLSFIYFDYSDNLLPQGGVNEAGLFYDFNAVEASEIKDFDKKIPFPGKVGHEMLLYILGRCKSVPEVIELFGKYKMPWMNNAQMNLADKSGNMGIITADSAWMTTSNFQVSTNYNLCHNDDDYRKCWRYPIAHSILSISEPDFELLTLICDSTSQRKSASTIYSNIHNLTTGEMWFYYSWDYEIPYKTTFENMLAMGDTVLLIRDLFANQTVVQAYNAFDKDGFDAGLKILNTIHDSVLREEKLKLLSLDALYESRKFTRNNDLIHQVITASNNEEILSLIASHKLSKSNKKLIKEKLKTFQKAGSMESFILGLMLIGGIFSISVMNKKQKNKTSANKK